MNIELEILDQLAGGPLPISVLATLTNSRALFVEAVATAISKGNVCVVDRSGNQLNQYQWLERSRDAHGIGDSAFVADITANGLDALRRGPQVAE